MFTGRFGPGRDFASVRASSLRFKIACTPLRLDVRRPASSPNSSLPVKCFASAIAGSSFGFIVALPTVAAACTGGTFLSGAFSAGFLRSLVTATSSSSLELSSSLKSSSNKSASSLSLTYFSSSSSSANASWFQNSSSAESSSSSSFVMRNPRVVRLGRAWDAMVGREGQNKNTRDARIRTSTTVTRHGPGTKVTAVSVPPCV